MDQFRRGDTTTSTTRYQSCLGRLMMSGATALVDSPQSVSQNTRTCNKLPRVLSSTR